MKTDLKKYQDNITQFLVDNPNAVIVNKSRSIGPTTTMHNCAIKQGLLPPWLNPIYEQVSIVLENINDIRKIHVDIRLKSIILQKQVYEKETEI